MTAVELDCAKARKGSTAVCRMWVFSNKHLIVVLCRILNVEVGLVCAGNSEHCIASVFRIWVFTKQLLQRPNLFVSHLQTAVGKRHLVKAVVGLDKTNLHGFLVIFGCGGKVAVYVVAVAYTIIGIVDDNIFGSIGDFLELAEP